ncbi:MAG: hypothetical protein M1834_000098 [Cirrosporium novae-zelandiae]|nr:MAG: hypothetical protein M1834_000098 [Cirrosporium novae-zelandiae]
MEDLETTVTSVLALLRQFDSSLSSQPPSIQAIGNHPSPLDVLSDSAKLLKAQTTKLSLLMLNKPFSPKEITYILKAVSTSCLPAMMSSVELYRPEQYSKVLQKEMISRVRRTFREMSTLLSEIPLNGRATQKTTGRDTLSSTGVVWESCDALIELKTGGIAGVVVKKAEQYRDLVKDAIEELETWASGEEDNEDDDPIFGGDSIPKDEVELKAQLDECLKVLNNVKLLFPATIKRRLKRYPTSNPPEESTINVTRLDELVEKLAQIPDLIDEAAGAFYDLRGQEAQDFVDSCRTTAIATILLMQPNWEGKDDEYTSWSKQLHGRLAQLPCRTRNKGDAIENATKKLGELNIGTTK